MRYNISGSYDSLHGVVLDSTGYLGSQKHASMVAVKTLG